MAAAWAQQQEQTHQKDANIIAFDKEEDKKHKKQAEQPKKYAASLSPATASSASSFSLHISQLPFDTTEWELRQFFVQHAGCTFSAVRLVYDAGIDNKQVFRGVAFAECATKAAYQAALKLHQSARIKGRRINVRPTKSKAELATIVQQRNELVEQKLQTLLLKRKQNADDNIDTTNDRNKEKRVHKRSKRHKGASPSTSKDSKKQSPPSDKNNKPSSSSPSSVHKKLTKKERNRRAAIIMGKKRARK